MRRYGRMRAVRRMDAGGTQCLSARGAPREGQEGDVARALDGHAEPALVPRAHAGHAARKNLAALLNELRKNVGAFVVDEIHFLDTKLANLLFAEILALAARPSTRATGATFAAWAARPALATRRSTMTARGSSVAATLAVRSAGCRGLSLLLFLCHDFVPFSLPGTAETVPQQNFSDDPSADLTARQY